MSMMETIGKIKSAMGIGPKVKVVGQIDLDGLNQATRPPKTTKEEREKMRQQNMEDAKAHNLGIIIKDLEKKRDRLQEDIRDSVAKSNDLRSHINEVRNAESAERKEQETRLAYLQQKQVVRERYNNLTLSNDQRQKELTFQGIRPKKMDVVHFHVPSVGGAEEMDGVALVRDENHYYLAIDMYPQPDQEDNATTMMDENPDGTFEGIWPKYVVLKQASSIEERLLRYLTDKYADELSAAEDMLADVSEREAREIAELNEALAVYKEADDSVKEAEATLEEMEKKIKQLNADLLATDAEIRRYRQEAATTTVLGEQLTKEQVAALQSAAGDAGTEPLIDFGDTRDTADYEPMPPLDLDTPTEQLYHHLPYIRGRRPMLTMNWPQIEDTYEGWLRYRLMSNVARLVFMLHKAHALTYVLSEDYYEELAKRGRDYYKGMKVDDVVPHDEAAFGAIVYPSQGYQDTILYRIDNRNQLSILVTYLRQDKLMFYESYSVQEVLNRPRTDHFICQSLKDSGTDPSRLFAWIRNLIIAFLAMEHDMERVVRHLIDEDKGSATETDIREDDAVDTTDDRDVLVRDYSWYTSLTVDREIPVRGYLSHRWCGKGKDKYIKEVWVRPHVKHGYHREAGVKK